jgi:hypothetical protein
MKGKYSVWGTMTGDIADQKDLQDALEGKVDKAEGKGLSAEDFTAEEKEKLAGIVSYTHVQETPSDTWNVQHNMGIKQHLVVFVTDEEGDLVDCAVDWPASTLNLLVLCFGIPTSGVAVVQKI